jgi:hypothetical protein
MADSTTRFPSFLLCRPIVVDELLSPGPPHDEERRGRKVYDDDRVGLGHPDHRGRIG